MDGWVGGYNLGLDWAPHITLFNDGREELLINQMWLSAQVKRVSINTSENAR